MTEQQLRKEYNEKWKKENPTKYIVWIVCYIADIIPLAIALVQIMGGLNDEKVGTMLVCLVAFFVLGVISLVMSMDQKRGWKAYLEANRDRLKK